MNGNTGAGWLSACVLLSCAVFASAVKAGDTQVDVLEFMEQEPGTGSYPVRVLVTPAFLRIDDGLDDGDYTLYDRGREIVYSISHEERSVLVIRPAARVPEPPDGLKLSVSVHPDRDAPHIDGREVQMAAYLANGAVCYETASVDGILQDAVSALAGFRRVLAAREFGNLDRVPEEIRTPCYLARYVYAPDRHLQGRLPVLLTDRQGYSRNLVSYRRAQPVSALLFELPIGYREVEMN